MASTKNENCPPKGSPAGSHSKAFESERISSQIDDFEKSGGRVEKLGVTRYANKPAPAKQIKPGPAAPGERTRLR